MGAAASVKMVYKDAMKWFRTYIDDETYIQDFKSIDKDGDNSLSYGEVREWVAKKAKADKNWEVFLTNGPVLSVAHKMAAKRGDDSSNPAAAKVVDVREFRSLLIQMFAISILWGHFKIADNWGESGGEVGTQKLNFEAFRLAVRTLTAQYAHEEMSDEQLKEDFAIMDTNADGVLSFIEICNFCCKFIDDPEFIERKLSDAKMRAVAKFFGENQLAHGDVAMENASKRYKGPKNYFDGMTSSGKSKEAVAVLSNTLLRQEEIAKTAAATEKLNNIRRKYTTIESLIEDPICCGYLLKFSQSEFTAENLTFILEVSEYRDLYDADKATNVWANSWQDTDATVKIEEEAIDEGLVAAGVDYWPSATPREVAVKKIDELFHKFLNHESQIQVCISEADIKKTKKRIALLHMYGPDVFEQACLDPIKTMKKDVMPRFLKSLLSTELFAMLATLDPRPDGDNLRIDPPDNDFIDNLALDSIQEDRMFTMDEILSCGVMYEVFATFIDTAQVSKVLKLFRLISILYTYIDGGKECEDDAVETAWSIYRYFVMTGSAYEAEMHHLQRKHIMLSLASPKKEVFENLRQSVSDALNAIFVEFQKTPEYTGLARLVIAEKKFPSGSLRGSIRKSLTQLSNTSSHSTLPGTISSTINKLVSSASGSI